MRVLLVLRPMSEGPVGPTSHEGPVGPTSHEGPVGPTSHEGPSGHNGTGHNGPTGPTNHEDPSTHVPVPTVPGGTDSGLGGSGESTDDDGLAIADIGSDGDEITETAVAAAKPARAGRA